MKSYQVSFPTTVLWDKISITEKSVKNTNTWRLNNKLLINQEITEEIKEEIKKKPRNKWQGKHDDPTPVGFSKSSSKREVYSNTILPQETRKISKKQPNLNLKQLEKEEQQQQQKNPKKTEGKKS